MEKFNIIPKQFVAEDIKAENAGDAIIEFATKMDSDMNNYFMAVSKEQAQSEIVNLVVSFIRNNQLTAGECSDIFRSLWSQTEVLGGKLWTIEDILHRLEEMTNDEVEIPQDVVDEVSNHVDTDILDDCDDAEWNAIDDAIKKADVRLSVSGIEWEFDRNDFDSEEEYKKFLDENILPEEMNISVAKLNGESIADYISDDTEWLIKDSFIAKMTA